MSMFVFFAQLHAGLDSVCMCLSSNALLLQCMHACSAPLSLSRLSRATMLAWQALHLKDRTQ